MSEETPAPTTAHFVVVKCNDCSKEQIVYRRPSTVVHCTICGALIANPTGGLADFRCEVLRLLP